MPRRLIALCAVAALLIVAAAAVAAHDDGRSGRVLEPGPCHDEPLPGRVDAALDRTSLGALPSRYEVGLPVAGPVRRVMMLIHGGAWQKTGQGALDSMGREAARWRAAGWETVNADYRACSRSYSDVARIYARTRASVGPKVPICVSGQSAGAQLALLLAAHRHVACVLAAAAPTDLRTMAAQGAAAAGHGAAPDRLDEGAAWVRDKGLSAFGARRAAAASPVSWAASIRVPVLLSAAADDDLVPVAQQLEMARALRAAHPRQRVTLDVMPAGASGYVHAGVSPVALAALAPKLARTVAGIGAAPGGAFGVTRLAPRDGAHEAGP